MRACGKRAKGPLDGTSTESTETSSGARKNAQQSTQNAARARVCKATAIPGPLELLKKHRLNARGPGAVATRAASKRRHPKNKETSSGAHKDAESSETRHSVCALI